MTRVRCSECDGVVGVFYDSDLGTGWVKEAHSGITSIDGWDECPGSWSGFRDSDIIRKHRIATGDRVEH